MLRGIISSGLLSSPTRLLPVVDDAAQAIYATDAGLTQTDMLQIAESFRGLSSNNVQFIEAVTQPYPPAPAQVELVQPGDGQLFSAIAHDVALPKSGPRTAARPSPPAPGPGHRAEQHRHAGPGRRHGARLTARGFQLAGTGDAPASAGSVVAYPSAAELPAARTLAAQVTGVTLRQDPAVPAGTVELILGASFTSLAQQPGGPASPRRAPARQRLGLARAVAGQPGQELRRHHRQRQLPDRRRRVRALSPPLSPAASRRMASSA